MEVLGLITFRKTSSSPSSVSAAPISRAVSRNRSNWGFSLGGGGLRAGMAVSLLKDSVGVRVGRRDSGVRLHPGYEIAKELDRIFGGGNGHDPSANHRIAESGRLNSIIAPS